MNPPAHTHGFSPRTYLAVFVALLALLAATVVIAQIDLGAMNIFAAMAIASLKAALVVMYFMQAKRGTWIIKVYAGAAVAWLLIAVALSFADYATREPVKNAATGSPVSLVPSTR